MDNAGSSPVRGAKGTYTAYMATYLKARYHQRRQRAISLLGGKCAQCGSSERLELDHIDRAEKTFDFAKIWSRRLAIFDAELKKAQLLCWRCHRAKSASERGVPHGGGLSGKNNCPCALCKAKKAEYNAKYRHSAQRCRRQRCDGTCGKSKHYPPK